MGVTVIFEYATGDCAIAHSSNGFRMPSGQHKTKDGSTRAINKQYTYIIKHIVHDHIVL